MLTESVPFTDLAAMTRDVRTAVEHAWAAAELEQVHGWCGGHGLRAGVGFLLRCTGCDRRGQWDRCPVADFMALGIGVGDEVILPANTFIASAEAVVLAGATPVFADVCPDTLLLAPAQLEAAVTPRTAAVIVVHLYGQMPDMDALSRFAERAGIVLIEDAAQAHGASWCGRRAGQSGARAASASTRPRTSVPSAMPALSSPPMPT